MNDKLLTLLMGKCWHSVEYNVMSQSWICSICGEEFREGDEHKADHPDFSRPADRDEFFTWLTKKRPEMWESWYLWVYANRTPDEYRRVVGDWPFIHWLFFQSPSRPRDLMAEWLRLDETVERFGWVEHHCSHCRKGDVQMHYTHPCEKCGAIGGKIRVEWAR